MKTILGFLAFGALVVTVGSLVGCGGSSTPPEAIVDTAAGAFDANLVGRATKTGLFELLLTARIAGTSVYWGVTGPEVTGIYTPTGTCTALGVVKVTINALRDGVPVKYVLTGNMKKVGGVVSGSGSWSSLTRGNGKWALGVLQGAANTGSWTLTKSGSPNRVFAWNRAYAGLVRVQGDTVLALCFDRDSTAWPLDAMMVIAKPAGATLGTAYPLNDILLKWSKMAGEQYYGRDDRPRTVTFSKRELWVGGRVSGKATATLLPMGATPGTACWNMKAQAYTNVPLVRDWR